MAAPRDQRHRRRPAPRRASAGPPRRRRFCQGSRRSRPANRIGEAAGRQRATDSPRRHRRRSSRCECRGGAARGRAPRHRPTRPCDSRSLAGRRKPVPARQPLSHGSETPAGTSRRHDRTGMLGSVQREDRALHEAGRRALRTEPRWARVASAWTRAYHLRMPRLASTHEAPGAPSSWRERLTIVLFGSLLTAILTYPTVRDFGSLGRFDTGDGRFSVWNVSWVAHAFLHQPAHLLDANIFYPHRYTLAFSELNLLAGLLAVPVYAATNNPAAAHNSAIFLSLLVCFVAMWALVRRLTGSSWAAVVASIGYTFSAFTASHTAQIQLLMIFGFPLTMLALHDVYATGRAISGVRLGLALALTGFACGYYGVYA